MASLELKNVSKSFGVGDTRAEVLKDINLKINEGEFIAIVGFTGSGKSTLINLIAGLLQPDEGEVLLNDKPVTGPGPEKGVYCIMPRFTKCAMPLAFHVSWPCKLLIVVLSSDARMHRHILC